MYSSRKDDASSYFSSSIKTAGRRLGDEEQGNFMDHDYKGHCKAGSSQKKMPLEQTSEPEAEELALEDQNAEERVTSQAEDLALDVDEKNPNAERQLTPPPDEDQALPVTNKSGAYNHGCCTCQIVPSRIGVPLVTSIAFVSVIGYLVFGLWRQMNQA